MNYDEAIAIRQLGNKAPDHLSHEAVRVIKLAGAMSLSQEWRRGEFNGLSHVQYERVNSLLAYRLALACGKLNEWRDAK